MMATGKPTKAKPSTGDTPGSREERPDSEDEDDSPNLVASPDDESSTDDEEEDDCKTGSVKTKKKASAKRKVWTQDTQRTMQHTHMHTHTRTHTRHTHA